MPTNIAGSINSQTVSSATQIAARTASSNSPKQPVVKLPSEKSTTTNSAESVRQNLPAGKAITPEPTSEEVKVAVEKLNTQIQSLQRELSFSVDEDSGRTVVKVIDSKTGDIVRQIPSDQVLRLARQLEAILAEVGEQVSGLLVEEQA